MKRMFRYKIGLWMVVAFAPFAALCAKGEEKEPERVESFLYGDMGGNI